MNKQKGLAPILIVILIALAVGGYFIYQKQIKPVSVSQSLPAPVTSPVASSPNETANWKTYTNTKYRFSFKYPPNQDPYLKEYVWGINMGCGCEVFDWFDIEFIPSKLVPKEWWAASGRNTFNGKVGINDKFHPEVAESSVSSKLIDGSSVLMIDAKSSSRIPQKSYERGSMSSKIYIFQGKDGLIIVSKYDTGDEQDKEFDQILSTFKFTQ